MAAHSQLWPTHRKSNLYQSDAESLSAELACEEENLFTQDDDLDITIIEMKEGVLQKSFKCIDSNQISQYIQRPREKTTTTVIQIHQPFSWAELEISKIAAQRLFTYLDISPGFWAVLKLFGSKENADHESAGGFNEGVWNDNDDSFEISYTAKHAEEHGRADVYDPWSIRQLGVHHKYDAANDQNVFMLLNPSKPLTRRLDEMDSGTSALDIHLLILCDITRRWAHYLAYLESRVKEINKKAMLSSIRHGDSRGFQVRFSDAQSIQNLQDTIIRVSQMLELNIDIFENVLAWPGLVENTVSKGILTSKNSGKATVSSIASLFTSTKKWRRQVESLLRRLDGSSVLIRSILDAKALETLQTSSRTTAELATLAREDGKKATQDARTLKTITILGFIYLPASFVASLLGTQYITVHDNESGRISLTFAREMWIFAILTLLLLLITVGTWFWWERHNRLADRAMFERSEKIE